MTNPAYKTPEWKLAYIKRAKRLRDALTDKALIARLKVGRSTVQRVRPGSHG